MQFLLPNEFIKFFTMFQMNSLSLQNSFLWFMFFSFSPKLNSLREWKWLKKFQWEESEVSLLISYWSKKDWVMRRRLNYVWWGIWNCLNSLVSCFKKFTFWRTLLRGQCVRITHVGNFVVCLLYLNGLLSFGVTFDEIDCSICKMYNLPARWRLSN